MTREDIEKLSDVELFILYSAVSSVWRKRWAKPLPNSLPTKLASLQVDEFIYIDPNWQSRVWNATRVVRKRIGVPDAKWTTRTTTKGLKVTRVK